MTASFPSTASLTVWSSLMSPRIFSQSKNRVFALNFRSSSETVSPLARSFSARWLPINPFPPVIRILEISFSPIHSLCYRRDVETRCKDAPSSDIPGHRELGRKRRFGYFRLANYGVEQYSDIYRK